MSEGITHTGGYHGTSFMSARRILGHGFNAKGRPVFFAPLDPEGLAHAKEMGRTRAELLGEERFSIIEAAFGATKQDYDSIGRPQIEIPADEARYIRVMGFTLDFPTLQEVLDVTDPAHRL